MKAFALFGLYFLILAALNALGKKVFLEKNYRNSDRGKKYQSSMIFPLMFLGCSWDFLGTIYYATFQEI